MNASPPGGEVEDPLERGGKGADTTESCDPTKIQDAYALCTETILTCLDARLAIITQPPTVQQDVVVALCQQKMSKEKKYLGLTASIPNCVQGVNVWPLHGSGSSPSLLVLSSSGNFYACISEEAPSSAAAGKPSKTSSSSSSSTREYKIALYGRTAAHVGGVVSVSAPKGSMPWNASVGGGEFCPSRENLFVYTGEAGSEDKKRREPSLLDLEPHGRTRDEQEGEEEEEEKEEREKEKGDPGGEEEEKKKQFEESLNAFVYKTDMGEQLQGHREGRLFLTDFRRRTTQMLQPPRDRFSCGQPRWLSDGSGIACTMWDIHPYCLGLIYCINRPSRVYLAQELERRDSQARQEGREQEAGVAGEEKKNEREESEEQQAHETKKTDDKKKAKQKACTWLEISDEGEDFAAFSPVCSNFCVMTPSRGRGGEGVGEGEQGGGGEEEDGENTTRIAYLSLRKNTEDIRPHMGGVVVKAVTLKRESRDSPWKIASREVLSEPLATESSAPGDGGSNVSYSGVYTAKLVSWVHKDVLFVNTFIGPRQAVIILDAHGGGCIGQICLELGSLTVSRAKESPSEESSAISLRLHDVSANWILLEASSLRHPPRLLLGRLSVKKASGKKGRKDTGKKRDASPSVQIDYVGSICLGGSSEPQVALPWSPYARLKRHLDRLQTSLLDGRRHTLLRWGESPRKDGRRSLAVVVHGGPHAVSPSVFSPEATFLSLLGFDVLAVNYRGSLGFGQKELLSLLGKAGDQDVTDVASAVESFIESNREEYDESRTVLVGGSHGGFLACHLIGRRPHLFAAASTRNPVTHLASMLSASDIPDWCFAEGLNAPFQPTLDLSEAQVAALCKASPVWNMRDIATPLLLGIGGSDRRVPPFQGIDFYKRLLSRGVPARLLYYPEAAHPIEQPIYAENYWINTGLWFLKPTGGLDALKPDIFKDVLC